MESTLLEIWEFTRISDSMEEMFFFIQGIAGGEILILPSQVKLFQYRKYVHEITDKSGVFAGLLK